MKCAHLGRHIGPAPQEPKSVGDSADIFVILKQMTISLCVRFGAVLRFGNGDGKNPYLMRNFRAFEWSFDLANTPKNCHYAKTLRARTATSVL